MRRAKPANTGNAVRNKAIKGTAVKTGKGELPSGR